MFKALESRTAPPPAEEPSRDDPRLHRRDAAVHPLGAASERTGLDPELIRALTNFDPWVEEHPPVRSVVGRSGRLLVHLPDVALIAGGLADSGLIDLPGEEPIPF